MMINLRHKRLIGGLSGATHSIAWVPSVNLRDPIEVEQARKRLLYQILAD